MSKTINTKKWYKPLDIAENGWIRSTGDKVSGHYNFIRKAIRRGKLKAQNYAQGPKGKPYWRVLGSEIIRWQREVEGRDV